MHLSIVLDCLDAQALTPFWSAAMGYRVASELPGFVVLRPDEGEPRGPVFILQQVPEGRNGKNRMHVDVHPPLDLGLPGLVSRLEDLGGRRLGEPVVDLLDTVGVWWQVMADPEGNELCVVAEPGHPGPEEWSER
ncbi:VOC family protein [Phycicoccus ginsengisoli]